MYHFLTHEARVAFIEAEQGVAVLCLMILSCQLFEILVDGRIASLSFHSSLFVAGKIYCQVRKLLGYFLAVVRALLLRNAGILRIRYSA